MDSFQNECAEDIGDQLSAEMWPLFQGDELRCATAATRIRRIVLMIHLGLCSNGASVNYLTSYANVAFRQIWG